MILVEIENSLIKSHIFSILLELKSFSKNFFLNSIKFFFFKSKFPSSSTILSTVRQKSYKAEQFLYFIFGKKNPAQLNDLA